MKKTIAFSSILCFIILFSQSCSNSNNNTDKSKIAVVGDKVLLTKDVVALIPPSISKNDSIAFIKFYVDNWVRSELLYQKAIENIDENDNIEKQVQKFREELYVNLYEQYFSEQKLDTIVPQPEILEYYKNNSKDYILKSDVVKPMFIVLDKNKEVSKVKKLFFSKKPADLDNLKDYCFQNSSKFYFADQWVDFMLLKQEIPITLQNDLDLYNKNGVMLEDSAHVYFIKINQHLRPGEPTPQELVYAEISKIIIHKHRIELLKNMRNKVYQDALHKKQFEVYY